ncbi:putative sulfate exporter family transporter [Alkaliphilus sp. MSJ-5]|uniref:Sulfate exporter family transporter n=1 Tax=Alkaliphilus flagellatus TaxID=2841507 RepID=A0ABS6FXI3_9FIRM|nr:putative sulfate exporter family transporter [Alkaliphilus flagellatus]MBU5674934.1 putative sulfate exporter family transporter [Alkaliphilus flagellatus]
MEFIKKYSSGILVTVTLAIASVFLSGLIPYNLIGAGVFALIIGMLLNPLTAKYEILEKGFNFTSKQILRLAIILMGATLSFSQVVEVGKFSLFVMIFTLITAFGGGYLFGKLFKMNWKLSGLISAGTGICGGSAVAAIAQAIDAEDSDIAYAISATFIFDIVMVILFPIMGKYFGMSDLGYGLWTGTAVNDTSSVVAAGYAFSDIAGNFSVIVKLTRTLSIVPVVLIFSYINERLIRKAEEISVAGDGTVAIHEKKKVDIKKIFPWFILMFLGMVAIKSIGILPEGLSSSISRISKFFMVMSLGAIGLKTNFKKLSKSGFAPMFHGFIISALVVIVAFLVQMAIGQI